jgi:transcriptional regulator with XRE-family HTH domain
MGQRKQSKATTEVDAYIGEKIHSYRNQLKLSQERLGKMLGVSFQMIQKYERGKNRLTGSRLQEIADVFKCPVADLFPPPHNGDKRKSPPKIDLVYSTREGMKLIDSFVSIESKALRASVADLAASLASYETHKRS